jgi:hypothetical protein
MVPKACLLVKSDFAQSRIHFCKIKLRLFCLSRNPQAETTVTIMVIGVIPWESGGRNGAGDTHYVFTMFQSTIEVLKEKRPMYHNDKKGQMKVYFVRV